MNDQNLLVLLDERLKEIAQNVLQEALGVGAASTQTSDDGSAKLRETARRYRAKEDCGR